MYFIESRNDARTERSEILNSNRGVREEMGVTLLSQTTRGRYDSNVDLCVVQPQKCPAVSLNKWLGWTAYPPVRNCWMWTVLSGIRLLKVELLRASCSRGSYAARSKTGSRLFCRLQSAINQKLTYILTATPVPHAPAQNAALTCQA